MYNVKGRSFFNFTTISKDDPKIKSKNVVACDSAAEFSVFKDISLFPQGVWKSEKEVFISGIQKGAEPIKVTMEGNTIFGVIGYSKEADINVLSLADIQENCSDWHGYGDSIYVRQGDKTYKFTKGNDRIFIWEPNDGVTDSNNTFAVASVTTVTEIKKQYTHRQVEHADMARKLQANMGYINENKIIQMIRLNKIDNCDVTENDIKNAVHIYGKSIEYLKGNSNGKKGEPVKFEPQLPLRADIQRSQMCSMDIMQIGKQISLVTVTTPLEMTFIKRLISKNEKDLGEAIVVQISLAHLSCHYCCLLSTLCFSRICALHS